jgi:hypothetical protein
MNEQVEQKRKRNFGQHAALASLVSVIAAWVVGLAYSGPATSATLEQGKFYAEFLRMILYGWGAICAIVALISIRKYGPKGILVAALLGLLWNSSYFIRGGPKQLPVLRAYARQIAALPDPDFRAAQSARPSAAATPAKQVIDYAAVDFQQLDKLREGALKAAAAEPGENALMLLGWADTLETLLAGRQKASDAEKKLIAADVLNPATVKSTDDFTRRRWVANDWSTAVHESEQLLQRLPALFRQNLIDRGVFDEGPAVENLIRHLPRAAVEAHRTLHGAEQAVAVQFNYTISALEAERGYSADRSAFQPRADSAAWKEQTDKLARAQEILRQHRQQIGLSDPWPR